jgi:hypothetical protein
VEQGGNGSGAGREEVGCEVGERAQNEGTFPHTGVGYGESGRVQFQFIIQQNIKIDRARTPTLTGGTSLGGFDLLEVLKEGFGGEIGLDFGDEVEEVGLVGFAPGLAGVEGREAEDAGVREEAEGCDGGFQLGGWVVHV